MIETVNYHRLKTVACSIRLESNRLVHRECIQSNCVFVG